MAEIIGWIVLIVIGLAGYWLLGSFIVHFLDLWICTAEANENITHVNTKEFFWLSVIFPFTTIICIGILISIYWKKNNMHIDLSNIRFLKAGANCADWLFSKLSPKKKDGE